MVLIVIGGLLTAAAFVMAFYSARVQGFGTVPVDNRVDTNFSIVSSEKALEGDTYIYNYEKPWFSQKIFYFHVPVAEASFLVFSLAGLFALLFLLKKDRKYDIRARLAMETGLFFVTATMITGVLWTKASWGVWWDWEPRLTTYFIMMVLMIAYFVVRNSMDDEERGAIYSSVFCLIAWIDAPISLVITRLIPSQHPVVFKSGMDVTNLVPFIIAQIGMLAIGYAVYVMRASEAETRMRIDILKEELEA